MAEKAEGITECVLQQEQEYIARGQALAADGRGDEANLMRIRGNICGVFCELLCAAKKNTGRQVADKDMPAEFAQLVENTTAPWKQRLELARVHGDAITAVVEQTKLETMALLLDEWKRREGGGCA